MQLLSRQLETFTKPVADSAEPERGDVLAAPASAAISQPVSATVNHQDALLNLLATDIAEAHRSRQGTPVGWAVSTGNRIPMTKSTTNDQ